MAHQQIQSQNFPAQASSRAGLCGQFDSDDLAACWGTNAKTRTRSAEQRAIINKLHRLCQKIGHERRYRVEMVCLALKHGLVADVTHYKLWDEGWEGLGERQWDTCFEMGDSELVIADVVERARRENFLDAVRDYCNAPGAFERWLSYADRQACLF